MHSTYIPHTVDTNVFKPMNKKMEMRKKYNVKTDGYLFGIVAANKDMPPRKSFQESIDAFSEFHRKHPNSAVYFHVLIDNPGGFPIRQYWNYLKLPAEKLFFLPPYDLMYRVGRTELNEIYNMFDCLLLPSRSEGFGVPAIEAQSVGVPVIVNRFSAMPELIKEGETGYCSEVLIRQFTPMLSNWGIPDPKSIYNNMEAIFKKDADKVREACRKWIVENYDSDLVYENNWRPFLTKLEKEILG
jgi:glycosyltransferase involved in cell wall biosynthesis